MKVSHRKETLPLSFSILEQAHLSSKEHLFLEEWKVGNNSKRLDSVNNFIYTSCCINDAAVVVNVKKDRETACIFFCHPATIGRH